MIRKIANQSQFKLEKIDYFKKGCWKQEDIIFVLILLLIHLLIHRYYILKPSSNQKMAIFLIENNF